jgi:hypothetical protein
MSGGLLAGLHFLEIEVFDRDGELLVDAVYHHLADWVCAIWKLLKLST